MLLHWNSFLTFYKSNSLYFNCSGTLTNFDSHLSNDNSDSKTDCFKTSCNFKLYQCALVITFETLCQSDIALPADREGNRPKHGT